MNLFNTLLIFCFALCIGATSLNAQNVNIPDANFKAYLVGDTNINTNSDTEIQDSEATAFSGTINCSNLGITDLTGIEAFVNLTELDCSGNQIGSLDVSQNTSLTILSCKNNQISSLDVRQNTSLTEFYCGMNQLSSLDVRQNTSLTSLNCYYNSINSLDVSQNTSLTELSCGVNSINSLDVSQNTSLTSLYCYSNQLISLDVKNGNNTNFTAFYAGSNPSLICIQVDDPIYSRSNWSNIDAITDFNLNCVYSNISYLNKEITVSAYPNPTTKEIKLDFGKVCEEVNIQISNLAGQIVLNKSLENSATTSLGLEGATGVYFLRIQTKEGTALVKVIKD